MDKNPNKSYLLIIIILLLGLYITNYFSIFNSDKECKVEKIVNNNDTNNEVIKEEKIDNIISTKDLVTSYFFMDEGKLVFFYGYLDNGDFYFRKIDNNDTDKSFTVYDNKMTKYEGLNNIKKLKTFNYGSDRKPISFLITEDGKLYSVYYSQSENVQVVVSKVTSDLEVEDIISLNEENDMVLLLKNKENKTIKFSE